MTDIGCNTFPRPANEVERLACLRQLRVLDTGIDPVFEHIVDLAKSVFQVPIVLVSLVDEDRQWFKARRGLEVREIAREHAFCNYTILSSELHVVEDTHRDPRFCRMSASTPVTRLRCRTAWWLVACAWSIKYQGR